MQRRAGAVALAVVATVTLATGCSGGSSRGDGGTGSSGELRAAISKLGNAASVTATIKLRASAGQLESFTRSQGPTLSTPSAGALAAATITLESTAANGKTLEDGGASYDYALAVGQKDLLTIRDVNKVLYVQADVKDLLAALNRPSTYRKLAARAHTLPKFAQDVIANHWVSLPTSTVQSLLGLHAGPNPVLALFDSALTKDLTVTQDNSGGTEGFTLTGNTKAVLSNVLKEVTSLSQILGAAITSRFPSLPSDPLTLHATVSNGALSSLNLDLAQFAKKPTATSIPLEIDFAQTGTPIAAPPSATPVDPLTLLQVLTDLSKAG